MRKIDVAISSRLKSAVLESLEKKTMNPTFDSIREELLSKLKSGETNLSYYFVENLYASLISLSAYNSLDEIQTVELDNLIFNINNNLINYEN